jgi:hypothetical protein
MFTRIASLSLALAALAFAAALAAEKEKPTADNTLPGSIVSVMDGKVTVLGKDGKLETTFKVGKELEVVCNGKKCELKDLKKGLPVTVTFKTGDDKVQWATKIESDNRKPGK